ncbi:MAG: soluble lytic murein transglycosylase [Alphaproteobacteria bacterium]|jgi:soluble lytic murein transglycosylase|tara:strand:+ start:10022 stop:11983 length:1962 start_codon:yes stop_codon:yes gene_type:complete
MVIFLNITTTKSNELNNPIKKPEKYNLDIKTKLPIARPNILKSVYNKEIAEKTINWLYLRSENSDPLINNMIYFIENNTDWPDVDKIQKKIEKKIFNKKPSNEFIIDYFKKFPPLSSYGYITLSITHFEQGNYGLAKDLYKHAWHKMKMSKEEEEVFLNYCNICINKEDMIIRFDRMYYLNELNGLQRAANRINSDYNLFGKFIDQAADNKNLSTGILDEISNKFKDNSTFHVAIAKYHAQKNNYNDASKLILSNMNSDIPVKNPVLWAVQQELVAKEFISQSRYSEAYLILSLHQLTSGKMYDSIEFLSGWLALKKLNKAQISLNHFENLKNNTQDDSTIAKAEYWIGMSYKELQLNENYSKHIENSSAYPFTFYGQLSIDLLNKIEIYEYHTEKINTKSLNEIALEKNELFIAAKLLVIDKKPYMASKFLYKLSELYPEHRDRLVLSRYANIVNLPQTSIRVAKKQNIHSNANLTFLYPINDFPELEKHLTNKKDNTIIYSIIRQESEFESKAISYSGAIGLMQIMPSTGKMLAKQEKIRYSSKKLQSDPSYNVNLGSRYISDLIKEFNGSYILAISAYNAGPNRVKKWIKKNGDPRKENIDSIDWIEMIPYKETRSYVKKVLSNMQIYRMILDNEINDIRLINDLKKSTI